MAIEAPLHPVAPSAAQVTPHTSRAARARDAGRRNADRLVALLDRLVPLARRVGQAVKVFTVLVAVAGVVILAAILWHGLPSDVPTWVALVLVVAIVATPPIVLGMFAAVLADVLELPAKLRSSPEVTKVQATELADLVATTRARPSHERAGALPGDLWRTARLLVKTRGELLGFGVVMRLASVPFLLAAAMAAVAGVAMILVAPVLVVVSLVLG